MTQLIEEPTLLGIIFLAIATGITLRYFLQLPSEPIPLSEEQKWKNKIQSIVEAGEKRVGNLAEIYPSQIDEFLKKYPCPQEDNEDYVSEKQSLEDNHAKIGELLLRGLIELDGLELPAELPEIRQERRVAIKKVQSIIKAADEQWAKVKNVII